MKVCVIGTRGFPHIQGGVEKHCEQLYTTLVQHTNTFFYVFRRNPYVKTKEKISKNIKFIDLPSTQIKGFETIIHSLLSTIYCLFIRPDIVHIHNMGPALFSPILKLCGIKIVLTYHSVNYEHKKWNKFAKIILQCSEKIAFNCSDAIIFVNNFLLTKVPPKIKRKSYYIPNGITLPISTQKNDYLKQIGVTPKSYILSVGRITPEKGFDILIQAYLKSSTHLNLIIVGGTETETTYAEYLKSIAKSSNIIFTGALFGEELSQLYQNAAFYILASRNEGFPLVLLEAMSYNLDLIVSDIPACHVIELEKECYFPVNDIETLSIKIKSKSKNNKNKKYNLTQFNWDNISKEVYNIYKNITYVTR